VLNNLEQHEKKKKNKEILIPEERVSKNVFFVFQF